MLPYCNIKYEYVYYIGMCGVVYVLVHSLNAL